MYVEENGDGQQSRQEKIKNRIEEEQDVAKLDRMIVYRLSHGSY